jgi:hypothetical protein
MHAHNPATPEEVNAYTNALMMLCPFSVTVRHSVGGGSAWVLGVTIHMPEHGAVEIRREVDGWQAHAMRTGNRLHHGCRTSLLEVTRDVLAAVLTLRPTTPAQPWAMPGGGE